MPENAIYSEFSLYIPPYTTWVKTQLFPIIPLTIGRSLTSLSLSLYIYKIGAIVQPINFSKVKEILEANGFSTVPHT